VLAVALLAPATALAKGPDSCGKGGPSKSNGEYEHFRDAKDAAVRGIGLTVFHNNENKLPAAGKNELYFEFDLGADRFGGRGAHRAVLLVQTSAKRNRVIKSYFTQDHYSTFCEIPR
jgi:ribonuclease T1